MRISVTEREAAERCGWRHDFNSKNRMNLESATPDAALGLGSLVHKALDSLAQYKSERNHHDFQPNLETHRCLVCGRDMFAHYENAYELHAGKMLSDYISHYQDIVGITPTQEEQAKVRKLMTTGKTMINNFLDYYHGELLPPGYTFLEPEQRILKQLPNTEHCTCYFKPICICKNDSSCRYLHSFYVDCKCDVCSCRELHDCEGTLDVLCRNDSTGLLAIVDYKTFTVHTDSSTLIRLPQFMGYTWLGYDIGVREFLYSGLWVRDEVPNGRSMADMFPRHAFTFKPAQLDSWAEQTARTALRIFDPKYIPVRTVHPVGGCKGVNNCYYTRICDARFENSPNYNVLLRSEYKQRERDLDYGA